MAYAKYDGEEVEVEFTARMVECDYGVDRSPTWSEPEDIEVSAVAILGVDVDFNALPENLRKAISQLSDEVEFQTD